MTRWVPAAGVWAQYGETEIVLGLPGGIVRVDRFVYQDATRQRRWSRDSVGSYTLHVADDSYMLDAS